MTALVDIDQSGAQFPYGLGNTTTIYSVLPIGGNRPSMTENGKFTAFPACTAVEEGICTHYDIVMRDLTSGKTYPVSIGNDGQMAEGFGPHITVRSTYNTGSDTYKYEVFVSFGSYAALTGEEANGLAKVFIRRFTIDNGTLLSASTILVSKVADFTTSDCYTSDAPHAIDQRGVRQGSSASSPIHPYVTVAYGCYLQEDGTAHTFVKTYHYSDTGAEQLEAAQVDIDPDTGSKIHASLNPSVYVFDNSRSATYDGDVYVAFEGQLSSRRSPRQIWLRHAYDFDHADGSLLQICTSRTVCYEPSVVVTSSNVWLSWREVVSRKNQLRLASFSSALTEYGRAKTTQSGTKPAIVATSDSILMSYEETGSSSVKDIFAFQIPTSTYTSTTTWKKATVSVDSTGGSANAESYDSMIANTGEALFTSYASDLATDTNGTSFRDLFLRGVVF